MNKNIVINQDGTGGKSPDTDLIPDGKVKKAAIYTVENYWKLSETSPRAYKLDINFVSNERITTINKKYLNRNRTTDVIAFSLEEGQKIPLPEKPVIGQIVISLDKAKEQASRMEHSVEEELLVLAIHGVLHVCGWEEGKEIQKCQEKIKTKILKNRI